MDLSQKIIELLRTHDCVVLPDFGGFVANYVPAGLETGHNRLTPPTRDVIFNPKINKNDGLLIQYLAESEAMTYQQARQTLQIFRDQAVSKLYKGETVEFKGLGTIEFNHQGNWIFHSIKPEINIETFGLPTLTLTETRFREPVMSVHPNPSIRLPRQRHHLVPIAAGIALLIGLSLIPMKGRMPDQIQTGNITPVITLTENKEQPATPAKDINEDAQTSIAEQPAVQPYILVGGSFTRRQNAETLFQELKDQGHHPELYTLDNGWYRVTVDSYLTWEEAVAGMDAFKAGHPGSTVWVSKR